MGPSLAVGHNHLYVADNSRRNIYVYDLASGALSQTLTVPERVTRNANFDGLLLHHDTLFCFNAGPVITYDLKTAKWHRFPWLKGPQADGFIVNIPALAHDGVVRGNELWVADTIHGIGVWDLVTEKLVTYIQTEPDRLYCSGLDIVDGTVITGNGWAGITEFSLPPRY